MSTSRNRNLWTPGEDAKLKALVGRYGDARGSQSRWKNVADLMPGRTAKDCRKRWFHSLDPSLRKGRWTAEEDQTLLQAYERLGPAWYVIAKMIPGRKDDQCAKRYNEILDPSAKNRLCQWSAEEDDILREGVRTLGNQWSAISQRLPGRPPLTCRNRWRALSRNSSSPTTRDTPQASADESTTNTPTIVEEDASESSSRRATVGTQFSFQSPGPLDPTLFADPGDLGSLSEWWNDPSFFHGSPMQAMGNLLASPRDPAMVPLGEASVIASTGTPPALNTNHGQKMVVAGGQSAIDDMQYITSSELTDSTASPALIAFPKPNSQPQHLSYKTGVQDVQFSSGRTPGSFTTTTNASNDSSTDEVLTGNTTQSSRQQRPHRVAPLNLQHLSTSLDLGLSPAAKASQNMFRNPPANSQAIQTHLGERTTADYTELEQNPEQTSSVVVTSNGSQHIYHHYHYHYHHHHHHYHHNEKT